MRKTVKLICTAIGNEKLNAILQTSVYCLSDASA